MLYIIKKILPLLLVLPSLFLLVALSGCEWFAEHIGEHFPRVGALRYLHPPLPTHCDNLRFEFEQGKNSEIINDAIKTQCHNLSENFNITSIRLEQIDYRIHVTEAVSEPNESGETINYFRLSSEYDAPIGDHSGVLVFYDRREGGSYSGHSTDVVVTLTEPTAFILGEVSITPNLAGGGGVDYLGIPYPKYTDSLLPLYITGKTNLPMDSLMIEVKDCADVCGAFDFYGPGEVQQLTIPTTPDGRTDPDTPFIPFDWGMGGNLYENSVGRHYNIKITAYDANRNPSNTKNIILELFYDDIDSFSVFNIQCGRNIQSDGSLHIQFKMLPVYQNDFYMGYLKFYLYQFNGQSGWVPNLPRYSLSNFGEIADITTNSWDNKFLMIMMGQLYDDGPENPDRTVIQDVQRNMVFNATDCQDLNVNPW